MSEKKSPDPSRRNLKVALFVSLALLLAGLICVMHFSERPVEFLPADQVKHQGRITPTPSLSISPVSQENAWQLEPNTLSGGWQRVSPFVVRQHFFNTDSRFRPAQKSEVPISRAPVTPVHIGNVLPVKVSLIVPHDSHLEK